jgi:hypothetical protein
MTAEESADVAAAHCTGSGLAKCDSRVRQPQAVRGKSVQGRRRAPSAGQMSSRRVAPAQPTPESLGRPKGLANYATRILAQVRWLRMIAPTTGEVGSPFKLAAESGPFSSSEWPGAHRGGIWMHCGRPKGAANYTMRHSWY